MSNLLSINHNGDSKFSNPLRSPPKHPKPWDKKLRSEFKDVPVTATDENLWYGPWDTALHRLFKDKEGFQIVPQYLCVCIVEVKPYFHMKRPKKRIDAYARVTDRPQELITDNPATTQLYGVSVFGERFLIMTMDTHTASVTPMLQPQGPQTVHAQVAPTVLWHNHVLKQAGFMKLTEMVENIKLLCPPFPHPSIEEIKLPSESDDESDTSDIPFA